MTSDLYDLIDVIAILLSKGARVKEKNSLGWTPLDEALSYGNRETSKGRLGAKLEVGLHRGKKPDSFVISCS